MDLIWENNSTNFHEELPWNNGTEEWDFHIVLKASYMVAICSSCNFSTVFKNPFTFIVLGEHFKIYIHTYEGETANSLKQFSTWEECLKALCAWNKQHLFQKIKWIAKRIEIIFFRMLNSVHFWFSSYCCEYNCGVFPMLVVAWFLNAYGFGFPAFYVSIFFTFTFVCLSLYTLIYFWMVRESSLCIYTHTRHIHIYICKYINVCSLH